MQFQFSIFHKDFMKKYFELIQETLWKMEIELENMFGKRCKIEIGIHQAVM